jgi:hypothetical protein
MTYSYTQISQYLSCPRRYRHRYLDGWQEKDTRAAMLFGRAFEQAVAALFRREDAAAVLFEQWGVCKDTPRTCGTRHQGTSEQVLIATARRWK